MSCFGFTKIEALLVSVLRYAVGVCFLSDLRGWKQLHGMSVS